jgi:hypothetical protein
VRLEKREARLNAYPERNISDGLRQGFSFRPVIYRYRAPINFEPQFGQFTPANALPEAMFHSITPWSLVWIATCHAKSSN